MCILGWYFPFLSINNPKQFSCLPSHAFHAEKRIFPAISPFPPGGFAEVTVVSQVGGNVLDGRHVLLHCLFYNVVPHSYKLVSSPINYGL